MYSKHKEMRGSNSPELLQYNIACATLFPGSHTHKYKVSLFKI